MKQILLQVNHLKFSPENQISNIFPAKFVDHDFEDCEFFNYF